MANNDVPIFIRIFGDTKDVSKALGQVKKDVHSWVGNMESVGLKAGAAFGAFGAALAGVAGMALTTSGHFAQMEARLTAVSHNAELAAKIFQQATVMAATTPFPVSQVVQAAVTMTAFRQSAQQTIPVLADLSAAMGIDMNESAIMVGKAMQGSARGFRSLHEQAGVTAADLHKFGAVLDTQGRLALGSSVNLDKARKALLAFLSIQFGGTAAKMTETLGGQFQNLKDRVEIAAASFGKHLAPAGMSAVKTISSIVESINELPDWLKAVAAGSTVVGAGLSIMAAAGIVATTQLLSLGAQASALATRFPALGIGVANLAAKFSGLQLGSMTLGARLGSLGSAFVAVAPQIAVLTAAFIAGEMILENYKLQLDEIDAALKKQSNSMAGVVKDLRFYSKIINDAAGKQIIDPSSLSNMAASVKKAFDTTAPEKMVAALERAGLTTDDLATKLDSNAASLEAAKKRYKDLADAISKREASGEMEVGGNKIAVPEGMKDLFGGEDRASIEDAKRQLAGLHLVMGDFAKDEMLIRGALKVMKEFAEPLENAVEQSKKLDAYLKFADKSKDITTMTNTVKLLGAEIKNMTDKANDQKLPTSRAGLMDQLRTAEGSRKQFIEEFLKKLDEQKGAQERVDQYTIDGQKEVMAQMDRRREREVALSDPATTNKGKLAELDREKKFLEERLKAVDGSTKKEMVLEDEFRKAKGSDREADAKKRLDEARSVSDEETKTRQKLRGNARSTVDVKATSAKTDLETMMRDQVDAINETKNTAGVSAQDIVKSYQGVVDKLEAWKTAHKDLIAGSDDLKSTVENNARQMAKELLAAKNEVKAENLTKIKTGTSEAVGEEVNTRNKILIVDQAIAQVEMAISHNLVGRKQGEAEIATLKRQSLDLARQEAQIEARDRQQGLSEEQSALDADIAILEQRKAAGENVEFTLIELRKQRLQNALEAINLEAAAEEAAGRNKEAIEQTRQSKIQGLIRDEYLKQLKTWQDTENAAKDHENAMNGIHGNRLGGRNSPIMSADEAFGNGLFGKTFGFGDSFSQDARVRHKGAAPSLSKVASEMGYGGKTGLDVHGQRQKPGSSPLGEYQAALRAGQPPDSGPRTVINNNATVNGVATNDTALKSAVLTIIRAAHGDAALKKGS